MERDQFLLLQKKKCTNMYSLKANTNFTLLLIVSDRINTEFHHSLRVVTLSSTLNDIITYLYPDIEFSVPSCTSNICLIVNDLDPCQLKLERFDDSISNIELEFGCGLT